MIHDFVDLAHDADELPRIKAILAQHPELALTPRPGKDKETAMGAAIHGQGVDEDYIQFWLEQGVEMDVFVACKLRKYDELDAFLDASPKLIRAKAKYAHNCDLIDLAPDRQMVDHLLARGYPLSIHVAAAKGMIEEIDRLRHNTLTTTTVISSSSSAVISAPKVVASSMRAATISSAEVSGVN